MAEKTGYVILRAVQPIEPATEHELANVDLWLECGKAEGHGGPQAVAAFLDADTELPEGEHQLKAVPARSWNDPVPAEVTTKRTAAIKRARVAAGA